MISVSDAVSSIAFRLLGESLAIHEVRERIRKLAIGTASVAIYGESGSGK